MISITARIPNIAWNEGFDRHWFDNDPVATHAFNALSFLFPQAERFFIEAAREVVRDTNIAFEPALTLAVKEFVTQEAAHTAQHNKYNSILVAQGYKNVVHDAIEKLQIISRKIFSPLTRLALVCGYEHYTAILGNFVLSNPELFRKASPQMALVWGWHAAEETEHKSVCFDLYQAAGGGWLCRSLVFMLISLDFVVMFGRNYLYLLHRDGCFNIAQLPKTIIQFSRFFFGRTGVVWHLIGYGVHYLSPWFHPWRQNNQAELATWMADNQQHLRKVA
jgi:hypothetical protein